MFAGKSLLMLALVILGPQANEAVKSRGKVAIRGSLTGKGNNHGPETNERMQKIIEALSDILSNAEQQEKVEAGNYKCYVEWCESTKFNTDAVLEQATGELDQKQASVKQLTAKIAHLTNELEETGEEIQTVSDALEQAKNIREQENSQYNEDIQTNRQSISQINHAVSIVGDVGNAGGFLQNGQLRKMQLNEPGESSYVLGIMKQLGNNLEKTGEELEAAEKQKQESYDALSETKSAQLKSLQEEKAHKQTWLQEARMNSVQDEHDVARLSEFVKENQAKLDETMAACEKKKADWAVRGHDRAQEKAALREAINYLNTQFQEVAGAAEQNITEGDDDDDDAPASFLQQNSVTMNAATGGAVQAQVAGLIAGLAVGGQAPRDGFDAAKQTVVELLAILQQQEAEEKEKKEYCTKSLAEKAAEEQNLRDELQGLNATIQKQEAETDQNTQEVSELELAIETANKTLSDATTIRKNEKDAYDKATKDRELSIKVMQQAKTVLSEFYAKNDPTQNQLLQKHQATSTKQAPETWQGSSRSSLESMNVLELIDKVVDDIRLEQKDADLEEGDAARAYEDLVEKTREEFEERTEQIRTRVKRKATIGVQRTNNIETQQETTEELNTNLEQQTSLHEECDNLLQYFDQRVKARQFEMDQLHDVYDILSGSSIASRTGLLQKLSSVSWAAQQAAALDSIGVSNSKLAH